MKNKFAFTLAEVLITLTIIGVIAALTIPNLMRKWQDNADIARFKKAYSALDQAIKLLVVENGNNDLSSLDGYSTSENANIYFYQRLKPYLRVAKECGTGTTYSGAKAPCRTHSLSQYKNLSGAVSGVYASHSPDYYVVLQGGTMLRFMDSYWQRTPISDYAAGYNPAYLGQIEVDINGFNGPNRYGYDYFRFLVGERGLIWPSPNLSYRGGSWAPAKEITHKDYCKPNSSGTSCAYWIIKHGNMNYKYRDVSAEW